MAKKLVIPELDPKFEQMEPGTYVLTEDVSNTRRDRRKRDEGWESATFEKGTRFIIRKHMHEKVVKEIEAHETRSIEFFHTRFHHSDYILFTTWREDHIETLTRLLPLLKKENPSIGEVIKMNGFEPYLEEMLSILVEEGELDLEAVVRLGERARVLAEDVYGDEPSSVDAKAKAQAFYARHGL